MSSPRRYSEAPRPGSFASASSAGRVHPGLPIAISRSLQVINQTESPPRRGGATGPAAVPERPALAPDVHLIGVMQGTGFKDRQWLIRRQGRFIQVTELLYKVAEQANGQHTLEEIAEKVTEATDWWVSPEDVRQLVRAKLMPLGLMAMADGTVAPGGGAAGRDRERSPLAVQLRLRALSPRLIEPITKVLQALHAPPVLIPILIAAALAHGWLYGSHGVSQSIRDALYRPGGLLLILAITIASDIFHEFGHAS